MTRKFAVLVVVAISSLALWQTTFANDEEGKKSSTTQAVLIAAEQLRVIAIANSAASDGQVAIEVESRSRVRKLENEISKIVAGINDAERLGLLARTSYGISLGSAATVSYDQAFHIAYGQCVSKLRKMRNKRADYELLLIKHHLNLTGHALEEFESY